MNLYKYTHIVVLHIHHKCLGESGKIHVPKESWHRRPFRGLREVLLYRSIFDPAFQESVQFSSSSSFLRFRDSVPIPSHCNRLAWRTYFNVPEQSVLCLIDRVILPLFKILPLHAKSELCLPIYSARTVSVLCIWYILIWWVSWNLCMYIVGM